MRKPEPRTFQKDGYTVEIVGPSNRCQVWIDGRLLLGPQSFPSLRVARNAAFGPHGYTKRHPLKQ